MKTHTLVSALALSLFATTAAFAHGPDKNGEVKLTFAAPIPNIPGKSLKSATVTYPPGGKTSPHTHAASAYIYAIVLEGEIRSQVEGEPAHVYKVGEFWTENPGAHHMTSENPSKTKSAKLLAVFVVDTDDNNLTTLDTK